MKPPWLLLVLMLPAAAEGQNSVYGLRGIGFPSRPYSVRARATGGATALFDETSAVNPATAANYVRVQASATMGTSFRSYATDAMEVTGLEETRFPLGIAGGGIGGLPVSFTASFATYAERTFDVTSSGTALVAGESVAVMDRLTAEGGVVDLRAALGYRATPRLFFGVAGHLLGGSSQVSASREFPNGEYRRFEDRGDLTFSGVGVSAGLLWLARPGLRVALAARQDSRLKTTFEDRTARTADLPVSLSGGWSLQVTPAFRWSASAVWQSWHEADDDLDPQTGGVAFDTWEVASGIELGSRVTHLPLRMGVRYATLPFSPTDDQPREWHAAVGTGFRLSGGRASVETAVERVFRDGAGVSERVWLVSLGLSVQP